MTTNPSIPILDLKEQYKQVGNSIESKVIEILRSGHYILGKYGAELEEEVAAFCGVRFGVAVANGTDALILALWSLDIGPGDEVITPPFTFAATAEAIALRGAKPVFVDVDPITFNIRPDLIEAAITERTKAILPVHLYGQPANMEAICAIAEKHGLRIVEDNAQGIGASRKGHPTGSWGDLACISFYPTKNLGAAGDAGMIVTDNEDLARRLKVLRAHGSAVRYFHDELGVNSRLDEIQAAVLLTKLPFLRQWNSQRNTVARWYEECLRNTPGIILPVINADNVHAWHQYTVRVTTGVPSKRISNCETSWRRNSTLEALALCVITRYRCTCNRLLPMSVIPSAPSRFRNNWRRKSCRCRCIRSWRTVRSCASPKKLKRYWPTRYRQAPMFLLPL